MAGCGRCGAGGRGAGGCRAHRRGGTGRRGGRGCGECAGADRRVRQGREPSGRAAGSFQAVKHRLADLYVRVQAAHSAAYYAAWDPAAGPLALAQALETLRITAAEAAQLHGGGGGSTLEQQAHFCFKRAAAGELLFGPGHRLREHAAREAGLFTEGVREAAGQVAV
ncbi:acyl-CoA dehydrogenase family protein [Streptomyces sp. M10(2022)]